MPSKRQKGMVLVSVIATALFVLSNIFFITLSSNDLKQTDISYKDKISQYKMPFSTAPYCGDLTCNYSYGENPLNCPQDCYM
jgi:hypothetical protein